MNGVCEKGGFGIGYIWGGTFVLTRVERKFSFFLAEKCLSVVLKEGGCCVCE